MGGTGTTDLKAAAQGLRLPSPSTALPPPGAPSAFQAPRNEDWRSKFRSSDSFTSDRGTPVCYCSLCIAVVFVVGIRCLGLLLVLSVSFASGIVLLDSAVVLLHTHAHTRTHARTHAHTHTHTLNVVTCGHNPSMSA